MVPARTPPALLGPPQNTCALFSSPVRCVVSCVSVLFVLHSSSRVQLLRMWCTSAGLGSVHCTRGPIIPHRVTLVVGGQTRGKENSTKKFLKRRNGTPVQLAWEAKSFGCTSTDQKTQTIQIYRGVLHWGTGCSQYDIYIPTTVRNLLQVPCDPGPVTG